MIRVLFVPVRPSVNIALFHGSMYCVLFYTSCARITTISCLYTIKIMNIKSQFVFECISSEIIPWNPEVSSLTNEREAKRRNTREALGAHLRFFERADPIRSRY